MWMSHIKYFQSLIETVKEQKNFIDRMSEVIDPALEPLQKKR